ncbi:right-handed parallel beta-helix repeat-containing protein [Vibrio algarum]|uniref:Right handed beta helix domain-containing protein n=1 Tax=Vibrio algarum TaxID=3020714 RepID=A0ABT4YTP1_9VIBR|nr:hypothetical protein [Vibrio sp. KJ40-1]MDB1124943.1 hypothetical protein [Vibrio sp. KJ40-1]
MSRIMFICFFIFHIPSYSQSLIENEIVVDGLTVYSFKEAEKHIVDGSTVYLGPGIYTNGLEIKHNNVVLSGGKETHFVNAAIEGKAAIITSGDNITIENIECSEIRVSSNNGSCIRHEGENLTVVGVYFHDSQQGILEASNDGRLVIQHSRFERLGFKGRAHGIYTNGAELLVEDSTFSSTVSQGHSIKSRSKKNTIRNTLISSGNGDDSRLIDIPNGGVLIIENSILHQSKTTKNRQVIGFGLEKLETGRQNSVTVEDSLIIMEREKGNEFIGLPKNDNKNVPLDMNVKNNVLVGKHIDSKSWTSRNSYFESRFNAGLKEDVLPSVSALPKLMDLLSIK